jgi:hypothetical protein
MQKTMLSRNEPFAGRWAQRSCRARSPPPGRRAVGGFRRETAEAALGHSLGAVEGAYRRETAVETRRVMMEAYVAWLAGKGADNVVAFPARA